MDLKERFAQEFNLTDRQRTPAQGLNASQLAALNTEAAQLYAKSPRPALSQDQRSQLSGKRSPVLGEILLQCANALEKHKEMAQETKVTPTTLRQTASRDIAVGRLIKATGDVYEGTGDAVLLNASEANGLGEKVLLEARERILGRDTSLGDPTALSAGFCEAFRLFQESFLRVERKDARFRRRMAPQKAEVDEARARQGEAELIADFLKNEAR